MCKNQNELREILNQYEEVEKQTAELSAKKEMLKDEIKSYLVKNGKQKHEQEMESGEIFSLVISTGSRENLDKEKVKELLGDKYPEVITVSSFEQFRITKLKKRAAK